jgi:hypothetical protein
MPQARAPETVTMPRARAAVRLSMACQWMVHRAVLAVSMSSAGGVHPVRSRRQGLTREAWCCGNGGGAVTWWHSEVVGKFWWTVVAFECSYNSGRMRRR